MKNLDIPRTFLKFGAFQKKGHGDKELDPRQVKNLEVEDSSVFLTFDICPSSLINYDIMNWLVDNEIKSTLFITVESMKRHEELSNYIINENFTIGGHGYEHIDTLKQSNSETREDIENAYFWWRKNFDLALKWYRVPYGHFTEESIKTIHELEMRCASWAGPVFDRSTNESSCKPNKMAMDYVKNHSRSGDILLMHTNGTGKNTFEVLKETVKTFSNRNFSFETLK